MKIYSKPEFAVMQFRANEAFSACDLTETESKTLPLQDIYCVVDSNLHNVFSNLCTNGTVISGGLANDGVVTKAEAQSYFDSTYGDDTANNSYTFDSDYYYVWYDGKAGAQPSALMQKVIATFQSLVGASGMGWHAGKLDTDTELFQSWNFS